MECVSPVFSRFCCFGHIYIKGNDEEGKVHGDLVFAEVAEAAVMPVSFKTSRIIFMASSWAVSL